MANRSKRRQIVGAILIVFGVLCTMFWLSSRKFDDYYSSGIFANSLEAARDRDVLVQLPALRDSLVAGSEPPVRVVAAWIQVQHRIDYPMVFGRRVVRGRNHTLEVDASGKFLDEFAVLAYVRPGGAPDTLRAYDRSYERGRFRVAPPFPDSIAVIQVKK